MAGAAEVTPAGQPSWPVPSDNGSHPYPGIPYLRTLRRRRGAWWRMFMAVIIGLVGLVILQVIALLLVQYGARLIGFDGYSVPLDGHVDAGVLLATNLSLAA